MQFILNGQASGDVASALIQNGFCPGLMRPYFGDDGQQYVTVNTGGKLEARPIGNANATLRKDDWKILDEAVVRAAKPRLQFVGDLRGSGLQYSIPNGMGKTVLETETQSDIESATISMDGMVESQADRPHFNLVNLPLPIIHKDFFFSARQVAASRSGGSPLDTTTAELAARRVAEEAEKLALGELATYTFGGGTIYGLTNFTSRNTKSMTLPTATGWTGATLVTEVLAMIQQAQADYHYGPYNLYFSPTWDQYLDNDYSAAKGSNTLRERLQQIGAINRVQTLDYLSDTQCVLVQMSSDVVREVIGMDITTVQWETQGGMRINYKVMAILVPQLRADHNGNCGIVHGTAS